MSGVRSDERQPNDNFRAQRKHSPICAVTGLVRGTYCLNLAVSINLEASELLEIFQWCGQDEADQAARESDREHFMEELADVMIYCIELAAAYDVDIAGAIEDKMKKNAKKYPVKQP